MKQRGRIQDKYPLLAAYGGVHAFLSTDEAINASVEDRIRSIWPFLTNRIKGFQQSLKARERANFDHEDTMAELWVELATKDYLWRPDRGQYITFAGTIIDRKLCSIRDKSRTVESPRNSSGRLKEYRKEAEEGVISSRRSKTFNDIRRTSESVCPIAPLGERGEVSVISSSSPSSDPIDEIMQGETDAEIVESIKTAIKKLAVLESFVLGSLSGLWGRPAKTVHQIVWETGRDEDEVRDARRRGLAKIRKMLVPANLPRDEGDDSRFHLGPH